MSIESATLAGGQKVELDFQCPVCGWADKLSVTWRPETVRWWYRCRRASCEGDPHWWMRFFDAVRATPEELYESPYPYLLPFATGGITGSRATEPSGVVDQLPFPEQVRRWQRRALRHPDARRYCAEHGWSEFIVRKYGIGYALPGEVRGLAGDHAALTFPVVDDRGEIANLARRFFPTLPIIHGSPAKWLPFLRGRLRPLYPALPETKRVLVVEGPADAITARSRGFEAVTALTGVRVAWDKPEEAEWVARIKDARVVVAYDPEGYEKQGRNLAAWLRREEAQDAWAIDFGVVGLEPKQDLSDFFAQGFTAEHLRALINGSYHEHRAEVRRERSRRGRR